MHNRLSHPVSNGEFYLGTMAQQPLANSRAPPRGTFRTSCPLSGRKELEEDKMNQLIYLIGLIVVILAILSFFGLR
jgi:hypothetical protein